MTKLKVNNVNIAHPLCHNSTSIYNRLANYLMETIVNLAAKSNNSSLKNRESRFVSHAIVELRKFKHLPFFCHSAVLLDLSPSGFKLEFTGETQCRAG